MLLVYFMFFKGGFFTKVTVFFIQLKPTYFMYLDVLFSQGHARRPEKRGFAIPGGSPRGGRGIHKLDVVTKGCWVGYNLFADKNVDYSKTTGRIFIL